MQFSVQADHLHLIVEAADKAALSRGMQGLAIRVARAINRLVSRRGALWADRFFARALTSPRSVRNALAYVLGNFRKHAAARTSTRSSAAPGATALIDAFSSAPYFAGFRGLRDLPPVDLPPSRALPLSPHGVSPPRTPSDIPVLGARTWLARIGWRRAKLLALDAN